MFKKIIADKRARKELEGLSKNLRVKIDARLKILARDGKLEKPFAKKITKHLFEIRINFQGQWRILYAYLLDDYVILLTVFQKKVQKTPIREIAKAQKRLEKYL